MVSNIYSIFSVIWFVISFVAYCVFVVIWEVKDCVVGISSVISLVVLITETSVEGSKEGVLVICSVVLIIWLLLMSSVLSFIWLVLIGSMLSLVWGIVICSVVSLIVSVVWSSELTIVGKLVICSV